MKQLIFLLALTLFYSNSNAQCPDCIPDESCVGVLGPQSCPEMLPDGVSNEYYEEVMTFYMPYQFDDPSTGVAVTLNQVIITDITGIPFGMDVTFNSEDLTYYPSEGEEHGCVTICGTPLLPGLYEGYISIHAIAEVFGTELEIDEQFLLTLVIYEGEGTNNSFSFDQLTGCGEADITFGATVNGFPQPTTWEWDFGNGNTSEEQFPPIQHYEGAGEYLVDLTTKIYSLEITSVQLTDLSSGWAGDIEELFEFAGNPDPYFTITNGDGNVIYTSTTVDNTTSTTWNGLSIALNDGPYSISFYDEDNITADDFLGTFDLLATESDQAFNVNSGTTGTIFVDLVLDLEFNNQETIIIFETTEAIFSVDSENSMISFDNPDLISFNWYFDGEEIDGAFGSSLEMVQFGAYQCDVLNLWGCPSSSESYLYCPDFNLTFNDEMLAAPFGTYTYQWYYNGELIEGENTNHLDVTEAGDYTAQITTDSGCDVTSGVFSYNGIDDITTFNDLSIFPNPSNGVFTISNDLGFNDDWIKIDLHDLDGKLIYSEVLQSEKSIILDLGHLKLKGMYLLKLHQNNHLYARRILIN